LNLVLLTGDRQEHRYLANRLDREIGLKAVVIDEGEPRTRRQRRAQLRRKYTLRQLGGRAVHKLVLRAVDDASQRRRQLEDVLGPDSRVWMTRCPITRVRGINGQGAHQAIRDAKPDRLLIYGTGIVASSTLALTRLPALNMHTGWSPDYRGADCAFWPLLNRQLELLGATVHEATADIDGGPIYGRARARLEANDRIHSIFARCVQAGTAEYVNVLSRLGSNDLIEREAQELDRGHEYRAVDLTLRADLRVRWAIRRGLVRQYAGVAR
jgi:methionyl-tRNA formyltransferase